VNRADGYYAQFAVQAERPIAHEATFKQVGIDVGLKAFSTDSDGATVAHPRYLRKAEKKRKRLHRRVSRTVKRSKNRKKASTRLAKGYLRASRQRKDFAAKAASALVTSRDFLAYEDLQITSLVKNHHLAKSSSDARWGLFLSSRPLLWAGAWHSRDCRPCLLHDAGLLRLWLPSEETPFDANPYLPELWPGAGPRLECRAEYPVGWPGPSRRPPYRRAGGNECCFGRTQRFWTDNRGPAQAIARC
jgi:hypothetical protein